MVGGALPQGTSLRKKRAHTDGKAFLGPSNKSNKQKFFDIDGNRVLEYVYGRETLPKRLPKINTLYIEWRVMVKLFMINIVPRDAHDGKLYRAKAVGLVRDHHNLPIGFSKTMLAYMKYFVACENALAFGMTLKRIFLAKKLNLRNAGRVDFKMDWNFDLSFFKKMGAFYFRGHWNDKSRYEDSSATVQFTIFERLSNRTTFQHPDYDREAIPQTQASTRYEAPPTPADAQVTARAKSDKDEVARETGQSLHENSRVRLTTFIGL